MREDLVHMITGEPRSVEWVNYRGFPLTDRTFSDGERCPTFMLANLRSEVDIDHNLNKIERIVQIAHEKEVDILVLPELCVSGYVWDHVEANEVHEHLRLANNRRSTVKRVLDGINRGLVESGPGLRMVIFGNCRTYPESIVPFDSAFVMASGWDYNDVFYDKIYLTPLEKNYFGRGSDRRLVIQTKWGRIGVIICYDLCFVDMGKKYAFMDEVDIIITLAAWRTEAVREYPLFNIKLNNYYEFIWNLMHSALAAHNQVWSMGVNCVGSFEKTGGIFCGDSGIWSPSGIALAQASGSMEELLIIRNLEIGGHMRHQAKEDVDYRIDFDEVYRQIRDIPPREVQL